MSQAANYNEQDMRKILLHLEDLELAICAGNKDSVKVNVEILQNVLIPHRNIITELSKGNKKNIAYDLIISACEHKQTAILDYLLNQTDILEYLPPKDNKLTDEEEDQLRSKAFKFAMQADNIDNVKLLYDYWRGNLHWDACDYNDEKLNLLSRLDTLVKSARDECEDHLNYELSMKIDVYCLIYFNEFQQAVYTRLQSAIPQTLKSDTLDDKTKAFRAKEIVRNVLDVYKDYSKINKVRLPRNTTSAEDERIFQQALADKTTLYNKWSVYRNYKEYFMKIDFYVSLMLLDNLNYFKLHYKNVADICCEAEYVLYHFIYRVYEDWRLYLPKDRQIELIEVEGLYKGEKAFAKLRIDEHEIIQAPVIFLERRRLKKCLKNFITKIEKEQKVDLIILPYLKDFYSLVKMMYYMREVKELPLNELVVDRALLVVGEIMNNENPDHLSFTTMALLQTILSIENIKLLHWIRNNYLGRAKCGELTKRILISTENQYVYNEIQSDIETIMMCVNSVLDIYRPILDKSLLRNGLKLIETRMNEWPIQARGQLKNCNRNDFFTEDFLKERKYTQLNKEDLESKLEHIEADIVHVGRQQLPLYIFNIRNTLNVIEHNNNLWDSLKDELLNLKIIGKNHTNSYPTHDLIKIKLEKLRKQKKIDLKDKLENVKDYSVHWQSVKNSLTFFLHEMKIFKQVRKSVRPGLLTCNESLSNNAIKDIRTLLAKMEIVISNLPSGTNISSTYSTINKLSGIEKLKNMIGSISTIGSIRENRHKLLEALINRISLMKDKLQQGKPEIKPLSHLLLKYEYDMNFRIVIEMLLIDINNVFVACGIRSIMNKSTNLLASVDLRNVLVHGNQILEVIGYVLDPCDFPTELLSKAKMVVDDAESIKALIDLFKAEVTPEIIQNNDMTTLNGDLKGKLALFSTCNNKETYINLVVLQKRSRK